MCKRCNRAPWSLYSSLAVDPSMDTANCTLAVSSMADGSASFPTMRMYRSCTSTERAPNQDVPDEGDDAAVPIPLMLATLTERRDFGGDWLLERKFDGERCVARKRGGAVRLESRTGKDLTTTYPEVRDALVKQRARGFVLDGEVVAFEGEQTSFSRLQQRLGTTAPSAAQVASYPVVYCVFDVLEIDGDVLTHWPLEERRARLTRAIRPSAALQLSEVWRDNSQRL